MLDILYAYFRAIDKDNKETIFQHTILDWKNTSSRGS